jgi:hypothetical protein
MAAYTLIQVTMLVLVLGIHPIAAALVGYVRPSSDCPSTSTWASHAG